MWKYFNPNPLYNGKDKGWKHIDCTVRSICAATGLSWLQVYDKLVCAGRKLYVMPHDMVAFADVLRRLGFRRLKSNKKVKEIAALSKSDNKIYICKSNRHVVCCRNGNILDTFDCSNYIINEYWIK